VSAFRQRKRGGLRSNLSLEEVGEGGGTDLSYKINLVRPIYRYLQKKNIKLMRRVGFFEAEKDAEREDKGMSVARRKTPQKERESEARAIAFERGEKTMA